MGRVEFFERKASPKRSSVIPKGSYTTANANVLVSRAIIRIPQARGEGLLMAEADEEARFRRQLLLGRFEANPELWQRRAAPFVLPGVDKVAAAILGTGTARLVLRGVE